MKRIALLLLLSSCIKTEVINAPKQEPQQETPKQRKEMQQPCDTARRPIEFNPSVEEWKED